jgi:hypothetical protein
MYGKSRSRSMVFFNENYRPRVVAKAFKGDG